MIYKLNDIALSTYGLIPARQANSNIAISGNFDLPNRIGKTHHEWEEGIEPYVSENELFFAGIDINLRCVINDASLFERFKTLSGIIGAFTELVPLETQFGTYQVYVKDEVTIQRIGLDTAYVDLKFRCPQVEIPVIALPTPNASNFMIDDISFGAFGFEVLKHNVTLNRPAMIGFQSTAYGKEAFKINNFGISTINVPLVIKSESSDFVIKMDRLKYALSREGVRKLTLAGQGLKTFCKDGMTVSKIYKHGTAITAMLNIPFTYIGNAVELDYLFEGSNQLTEGIINLKGAN